MNGKEAPIIPAFEVLRGVLLPAGKSEGEFYLKTPNFSLNIYILIASLLSAILIFFFLKKIGVAVTKEAPPIK